MLTFGVLNVQIGVLPDTSWFCHLEEIVLSSSTSMRGQLSFGSLCLFVSPASLGTEICTVQLCKSPIESLRLPRL
jgi:hypothetical protein